MASWKSTRIKEKLRFIPGYSFQNLWFVKTSSNILFWQTTASARVSRHLSHFSCILLVGSKLFSNIGYDDYLKYFGKLASFDWFLAEKVKSQQKLGIKFTDFILEMKFMILRLRTVNFLVDILGNHSFMHLFMPIKRQLTIKFSWESILSLSCPDSCKYT